jgi:hypothetical protein
MTEPTIAADQRVADVRCDDTTLTVTIANGSTVTAPLADYPRLRDATPEQRAQWEVSSAGYGIHWPAIDEDLSVEGLVRRAAAPAH